jgi:signal transduction histidine kinase
MLGYTGEELKGMMLYDLIELPREEVDATLRRTLEQGRRPVGERRYRRKDGTLVDVEIGASVIRYGGGEVVCAVVRDITERKRAERALREVKEAERNRMARDLHDGALQDLAYALAEVETARMIPDDPGLDARLERAVDVLRRVGRELRAAVNDLRLGEERNRSLPTLVESLVKRNRGMVPSGEIGMAVEEGFPATPLGDVGADVLRILQEALTNARRHSGARKVFVSLKVEDDNLVAEVSDDGRGFDPETPSRIGLRSMRERAAALGGRLEVESAAGEGTRVRLLAPMRAVSQKGSEAETGGRGTIDEGGG